MVRGIEKQYQTYCKLPIPEKQKIVVSLLRRLAHTYPDMPIYAALADFIETDTSVDEAWIDDIFSTILQSIASADTVKQEQTLKHIDALKEQEKPAKEEENRERILEWPTVERSLHFI